MKSVTLKACRDKGHSRSRHSPDGFNIIEECPECYAAWMIQGVTGEEIRLAHSYAERVFSPTYNEQQRDKAVKLCKQ